MVIYINLYEQLSLYLLSKDVQAINGIYKNLKEDERDIFFMNIMPYASMCIDSATELFINTFEIKFISEEEWNLAKRIRTKLKMYNKKIKRNVEVLDSIYSFQDEYFEDLCKFQFIKDSKMYYNFGTYLLENKYIGNNFLFHWYFGYEDKKNKNKKVDEFETMKASSINIGKILGKLIDAIGKYEEGEIDLYDINLRVIYNDYNLSKDKYKLFSDNYYESITIIIFNILCSINFILYFLGKIIRNSNQFYFRAKYLCYYYSILNLSVIENYTKINYKKRNSLDDLYKSIKDLNLNSELINTPFRNCMAHYIIKEEYIKENELKLDVPLYGLVEKYFGKDYVSLNNEIHDNLVRLANVIEDFILAKPD